MPLRHFTLTEAVRALPQIQTAVETDGLIMLDRRGKIPLLVVQADLALRMLKVVDQLNRFLSDPAIARFVAASGFFSKAAAALDDSPLGNLNWSAQVITEIEAAYGGK